MAQVAAIVPDGKTGFARAWARSQVLGLGDKDIADIESDPTWLITDMTADLLFTFHPELDLDGDGSGIREGYIELAGDEIYRAVAERHSRKLRDDALGVITQADDTPMTGTERAALALFIEDARVGGVRAKDTGDAVVVSRKNKIVATLATRDEAFSFLTGNAWRVIAPHAYL